MSSTTITTSGRRSRVGSMKERQPAGGVQKRVAVLGMGAMGSRMGFSLLKAGHSVTVWNRTPEGTKPLIEQGASMAASPKEAAEDADVVLSMVRDDEASRRVWLAP